MKTARDCDSLGRLGDELLRLLCVQPGASDSAHDLSLREGKDVSGALTRRSCMLSNLILEQ